MLIQVCGDSDETTAEACARALYTFLQEQGLTVGLSVNGRKPKLGTAEEHSIQIWVRYPNIIEKEDCAFWRAGACHNCKELCRYSKE